jgi:hypothetical protein
MAPMRVQSWRLKLSLHELSNLPSGFGLRVTKSSESPLWLAALKIARGAADTTTPTQSGDFEDSVAALQDADALAAAFFRFMAR